MCDRVPYKYIKTPVGIIADSGPCSGIIYWRPGPPVHATTLSVLSRCICQDGARKTSVGGLQVAVVVVAQGTAVQTLSYAVAPSRRSPGKYRVEIVL